MEPSSIQPYDILMIMVIVGATAFGARKGMAWQLASLASLIVSAIVAVRFYPLLPLELSSNPQWNRYLVMLILYLGTSLAIWVGFRFVAGIIDRVKLQGFDHQAGGVFGFAKGVLLCLVITFFAVTLSEWARQKILVTYSGRYIAVLLEKGTPLLPDDLRAVLGKYIEDFEGKLAKDGPASGDLSPGSAVQDLLKRELAPELAPAPSATPLRGLPVSGASGPAASQPAAEPKPQADPDFFDEPLPKGMKRVP